jgi:predicted nuclease of predicted toxin-antitoxin system
MRFLCDVHITYKIVNFLCSFGFEAVHVNEILHKSQTKDSDICKYADLNDFIVITKDSDFRDSYFIKRTPKKLIKINLGNISNQNLIEILSENIKSIQSLNSKPNFLLEVDMDNIEFIELE